MKILSIETSCDETAIAIAEFFGTRTRSRVRILSNIISSQIKLHAKFGGVVPNLAKREHQCNLAPVLLKALEEARLRNPKSKILNPKPRRSRFATLRGRQIQNPKFQTIEKILQRESELLKQFEKSILLMPVPNIDAIAVTIGPGLAPALWVGVNFARALSYLWKKPLIPVNHMAGHVYSPLLPIQKTLSPKPYALYPLHFPAIALLVSGGHTELVLVKGYGNHKIIGETLDDAAGEAFDKVARLLGLGYPGGPAISALAEMEILSPVRNEASNGANTLPTAGRQITNSKFKISLPRPMLGTKDYNFSFSGLKTAVLYLTRDLGPKRTKELRPLIAKEFQNAVIDVLVAKTVRAAKKYKIKTIFLGGGVAANHLLRRQLGAEIKRSVPNTHYLLPNTDLTGDNALIIALAAFFSGKPAPWKQITADANLRL